ncbi:protein YgfX [Undibacterium sp. Xuan67W]
MIIRKFPGNGKDATVMVVQLCRETTLWPCLMMLHLRPEQGVVQIVPVLRDSVDASAWRALSVSLRWLAVHERNQKNTSLTMGNF